MKAAVTNRQDNSSGSMSEFLCWLFPITYLLHISEEWWGDYPAHLRHTQDIQLSHARFSVLQGIGLLLMILGIVLSRRLRFPNQMLAILSTLIIGNAILHVLRSALFGVYEPGLVTSILFWLPLGSLTLAHQRGSMSGPRFLLSAAIGISICGAVEILTVMNGAIG